VGRGSKYTIEKGEWRGRVVENSCREKNGRKSAPDKGDFRGGDRARSFSGKRTKEEKHHSLS